MAVTFIGDLQEQKTLLFQFDKEVSVDYCTLT